jgi:hypothetical protein
MLVVLLEMGVQELVEMEGQQYPVQPLAVMEQMVVEAVVVEVELLIIHLVLAAMEALA